MDSKQGKKSVLLQGGTTKGHNSIKSSSLSFCINLCEEMFTTMFLYRNGDTQSLGNVLSYSLGSVLR